MSTPSEWSLTMAQEFFCAFRMSDAPWYVKEVLVPAMACSFDVARASEAQEALESAAVYWDSHDAADVDGRWFSRWLRTRAKEPPR